MDNLPLKYHDWSGRLAMDIALCLEQSGESLEDVMERHNISIDDLGRFNTDSMFLKKVEYLRGEVREKGMTFKLKARAQAEELLTTSWTLIHDASVSATVKADLIKATVKWGGLEPKGDAAMVDVGGGVSITINLGESHGQPALQQAPPKVIEHVE